MGASYWDWLPPEIKQYIVEFAESQRAIDQRNKQVKQKLNEEMGAYHKIQEAWGLGRLQLKRINNRLRISGYYLDDEGRQRYVFLGWDKLDNAMRRIKHVKSFL